VDALLEFLEASQRQQSLLLFPNKTLQESWPSSSAAVGTAVAAISNIRDCLGPLRTSCLGTSRVELLSQPGRNRVFPSDLRCP